MLLNEKVAVIHGGAGAIGGAVARAFAQHGAHVFLTGRTLATVEAVAAEITAAGGHATAGTVDVLQPEALRHHLDGIVARTGRLDISFNATGFEDVQGSPLTEMTLADVTRPVELAVASHFNTATAAARHMTLAGSGVILGITAYGPSASHGGFGLACAATERFCQQLALEVGPAGVRVVCLRSAGSPDAPGLDEVLDQHARKAGLSREEFEARMSRGLALRRLPKLAEIGNAAVLAASDLASAVTAAILDVTCGSLSA